MHQVPHLTLQLVNSVFRPLDGCNEPAPVFFPAVNAVKLLSATPFLRLKFIAMPAVALDLKS